MTPLHALATDAGLRIDWEDYAGEPQRVSDAALVKVLAALDLPADSEGTIAESRRRLADQATACSFVSADVGTPVPLPAGGLAAGAAGLELEDGSRRSLRIDGRRLPGIDVPGYHRLVQGDRVLRLAIAPRRCFGVADAAGGKRLWGPAVQIAGLRDTTPRAFGDFGSLAETARSFAAAGAGALAISPVHALFPADPSRYSPYAPSSRLFLNILYADPALAGHAVDEAASPELIDWSAAIPARLRQLRAAFAARSDAVRVEVADYVRKGGDELLRHARFDALHAHFFAESGATGWQGWPTAFHDPAGDAVARFAAEHAEEVDFYLFCQWLAKRSLDAAQRVAIDGGMALGLIADLAVGMDGGGSHAWSRRDDLLTGLSLGAPPDLLGPEGQSWGITGFSPRALQRTGFEPYIATLRAALDHAGGIRIDHALGLRRLWVVPEGASPRDGAYLTMPLDDMLRVLAIESHRARAVVIGEDLGTVPEGFRPKMDARSMLGMRVLPFERDEDGFIPAERWSEEAAAMTGTHDLATVAGWWVGRDIDWNWRLGRTRPDAVEADERATRAEERTLLWQAFTDGEVTDAAEPSADDPAPAVDAALAFIAGTPCELAILPIEDLIGAQEQPNLPGTIDEHPNWRRRMPAPASELLDRPEVARRVARINAMRNG
ncbi:4-alpha-glucanotransferase [Sphingomonas desiccabilis]|uniref:4-alpha-glucanotransferase n=1 Tax=Sphingomonas desiccabilis TaxID=429134 RepID=A0A4Q2ITK4_9SPHN|nr:4-alpha-glucanotransferase [Sphingomonas desiccabilis]MBB3911768.1 4-alpha-glucanotransferase [Sphingomonas desiccabilis]RXZ31509.1 4-alpha-glucanotransferase [Sphingomonas desiccabilis]